MFCKILIFLNSIVFYTIIYFFSVFKIFDLQHKLLKVLIAKAMQVEVMKKISKKNIFKKFFFILIEYIWSLDLKTFSPYYFEDTFGQCEATKTPKNHNVCTSEVEVNNWIEYCALNLLKLKVQNLDQIFINTRIVMTKPLHIRRRQLSY